MTVRTRIAPSPTGRVHIGTLRTALFDYFLARQQGGQFILRVEDTDRERLVPGAMENLLHMFEAMDIEYDEGPFLQPDGSVAQKGDYGPYIQSERLPLYQKYADELVKAGKAYPCFCTVERLEEMRKEQAALKQTTKYDRKCLRMTLADVEENIATCTREGRPYVIRLKVPDGSTTFHDAIRGPITFDHAEVDDCILMKSDGFPSYYLACVVDDHLMNISHVLRGEEWISSTPKSLILFQMFGWEAPTFAHVPLLLGPDKKKLSKRSGDTAVEEYLKHGYLKEALVNFIGTLGFNPSSDREIFSRDELVSLFDLSKVNKGGAVLNIEKLDWMNRQYLINLDIDDLAARVLPFLHDIDLTPTIVRALSVERTRVSRLTEFQDALKPYISLPAFDISTVVWKKADKADALLQLTGVQEYLMTLDEHEFSSPALLEERIKEYIGTKGLQNGNVLWPLRVALSGQEKSATPFELLWVLGKEASLARIASACEKLRN